VSDLPGVEIIDVGDIPAFGHLPPCADPRFDHRSCDYWEDEVRGAKSARPSWWQPSPRATPPAPASIEDNPFAPARSALDDFNPFAPPPLPAGSLLLDDDDQLAVLDFNPFAPTPPTRPDAGGTERPRKLRLLDRGRTVFGSYAKVLLHGSVPAAYAQFGPLSAYPRARRIRDLYPRLPQSPLPAVITCVATTKAARGRGFGQRLVEAVIADLAARGFAAIEAYPDLDLAADEASAATPGFWERCGFTTAVADERYPVMRIDLD
jgi:GNAT superfamily N-acetyltransferase